MIDLHIRTETPSDHIAIDTLTLAAFEAVALSQQTEHLIVRALRDNQELTVSLVAEVDGEVVGHIAVSPVELSDGSSEWYGIGPLSVDPQHQNRGVGSTLINAAIAALKAESAAGLVLLGEPEFYNRFGFAADPRMVLPDVPATYFMVLPFRGEVPTAEVRYSDAFLAGTTD